MSWHNFNLFILLAQTKMKLLRSMNIIQHSSIDRNIDMVIAN